MKYIVELAIPVWVDATDCRDAETKALRLATAGVLDEAFHKNVTVIDRAYKMVDAPPPQLSN